MSEQETRAPKKSPKKILKDLKRPLLSGGIIATIAFSGIIGGIILFNMIEIPRGGIFVMGYSGGLVSIDPLNLGNNDPIIINQIAEPLFTEWSNQTTRYNENVPHLAEEGTWSIDNLNFTCTLKEGIEFHDGTKFNATAVKWNFDRLQHLITNISYPFLWYHSDGTPILNRTEVIDEFTIKFVLNKPYVPFRSLLTYLHTYILSPSSTPKNRFLDVSTEKIIGTGPYIYETNVVYVNTTIIANYKYWGRPKPIIDKFIFLNIDNSESNERFFNKETHYAAGNDSYIEEYNKDSTIVIDDFIERGFDFLGMNNKRINTSMRKAISYSLNYTEILKVHDFYSYGSNIRCKSPLALGTLYSNWEDFNVPSYNITKARQALKEVNWPGTTNLSANDNISSGNEWEMIANGPKPLGIYNISYIIGKKDFITDLPLIITENLKQIGVKIETYPMTSLDYWGHILAGKTDLFKLGWNVPYNDPSFTINLMFSSKSDGWQNFQQTNDSLTQQWMEEGLLESNPTLRNNIYFNIQKRLIEEVYPLIWLYSCVWYDVYRSNLRGWGYWGAGAFKNLYFV